MKLLILFIVMNIINVVIQTIKSIATIKCGKMGASVVNALAYGLYTYIVVLTMCDLPLLWKCLIVAGCNFIGVWVVKFFEEKARKDKLWKVEATVPTEYVNEVAERCEEYKLPFNCFKTSGDHHIFNIFCATQFDSRNAKLILDGHRAKYFASESKTLY